MYYKKCQIEGCNREHCANGLCDMHNKQKRRTGGIQTRNNRTPNEIIECKNICKMHVYDCNNEIVAITIFDKRDRKKIEQHKWHQGENGAIRTLINGKMVQLHKFLAGMNRTVKHRNGNKLDNRRANLEVGYLMGVFFKEGKFCAQYLDHYRGGFDNEADAYSAYLKLKKTHKKKRQEK